jgi:hypothetical protein
VAMKTDVVGGAKTLGCRHGIEGQQVHVCHRPCYITINCGELGVSRWELVLCCCCYPIGLLLLLNRRQ